MSDSLEEFDPDALRREGLIASSGAGVVEHDGTGRVDLSFTVEDKEAPPARRKVRVPPGVTVFDSASWNGIAIDSTCGGHGTCHKCKVRLAPATPATRHDERTFSRDQLDDGWRLACLVPRHPRPRRSSSPRSPPGPRPRPSASAARSSCVRPSRSGTSSWPSRPSRTSAPTWLALLAAIEDLEPRADLHVLRRLPKVLREADFKVTAVIVDEELIDVEPGDTTAVRHAIAFDLGTTTVVATLLDLVTGTPVAVASMLNKQQPFGGDVITRISATMMDPDAAERLRVAACETLDELAAQVCREGGVDPEHVYEVAIAGNATMTALALGIDPEPLGVAPFIMTTAQPPTVLAADLGLALHPRARALLFPALGAYVGGDIVAGMLASGMDRDKRTRLFIDVGTNCEIVLSDGDRIVATAAPAGPAFEGGAIRCGMRADDGAIEVVGLDPEGGVMLGVIGDVEPRGLCGSGLVDIVAELVRVGSAGRDGSLRHRRGRPRDRARTGRPAHDAGSDRGRSGSSSCTDRPRTPTPPNASCSASATSASCSSPRPPSPPAGRCCSRSWTWSARDVQQVLLAGSFGSYLSAASAVRIGLVPQLPVLRIVAAGNVAGEGAKMALLSVRERAGAAALLEEVTYVELSDRPEFNDRFVDQLGF